MCVESVIAHEVQAFNHVLLRDRNDACLLFAKKTDNLWYCSDCQKGGKRCFPQKIHPEAVRQQKGKTLILPVLMRKRGSIQLFSIR